MELHVLKSGIETAVPCLLPLQAGTLVVGGDPFFNSRREQLAAPASRPAIPAIYEYREFPWLAA